MKNILNYLIYIGAIFLFASCEDESLQRIPSNLDKGPNVRVVVDPDNAILDLADIENAKFAYKVYSESTNLDSVKFSVTFTPLSTGEESDPIVIERWGQSDFSDVISVEYTANELALLFGLSGASDLGGGDIFLFSNITSLTNGLVFPSEAIDGNSNTPPGITQATATTSFTTTFGTFVACPVLDAENFAVGKYKFSLDIPGGDFPFGVPYFGYENGDSIVTLSYVSTITRKFKIGHLWEFVPDHEAELSFLLICENIIMPVQGGGLACSGTSLSFQTASDTPGTYNSLDDSQIVIRMEDTGGCGVTGFDFNLILDKIEE